VSTSIPRALTSLVWPCGRCRCRVVTAAGRRGGVQRGVGLRSLASEVPVGGPHDEEAEVSGAVAPLGCRHDVPGGLPPTIRGPCKTPRARPEVAAGKAPVPVVGGSGEEGRPARARRPQECSQLRARRHGLAWRRATRRGAGRGASAPPRRCVRVYDQAARRAVKGHDDHIEPGGDDERTANREACRTCGGRGGRRDRHLLVRIQGEQVGQW
jgi:hypothetical protein